MSSTIQNINNHFLSHNRIDRQNGKGISIQPNAFSEEITTALQQLSDMENSSKLREDAVRNGKAVIENWQPPTDEQIAKIFTRMKGEFFKSKVG